MTFAESFAAFKDYKCYFQAFALFLLHTSFASLPAFLSTIVREIGLPLSTLRVCQCLPISWPGSAVSARPSFRTRSDSATSSSSFSSPSAAWATSSWRSSNSTAIRYLGIYFITCSVFPSIALNFTWMTDNQGPSSKRGAGLAIFGMISQSDSFLGARIFPGEEGPYYAKGMAISSASLFTGALLMLSLSLILRWENRRRDGRSESVANAIEISDEIRAQGEDYPSWRFVV